MGDHEDRSATSAPLGPMKRGTGRSWLRAAFRRTPTLRTLALPLARLADEELGSHASRGVALPLESPVLRTKHHDEVYYHGRTAAGGGHSAGADVPLLSPSERHVSGKVPRDALVGSRNDYRRNTYRASILTMINSCLGASLLVLPFVCLETGVVMYIAILGAVAFLASESLHLLTLCVKWTEQPCYQGVARAAYGWWGAQLTTIILILQLYGYMTAYLIVVGSTVQAVLGNVSVDLGSELLWQIGVSAVFVLPLCMLRRMQYLRFSAYFAIFLFTVYVIASTTDGMYELLHYSARPAARGDIIYVNGLTKMLAALPVLSCSYCAHPNMFPILEELKRPTAGRLQRVARWGMFGTFLVYLFAGVFGYFTYLTLTKGDLIVNFNKDSALLPHAFLLAISYCIGSAVLISVPMQCFELRTNLDAFFFPGRKFTWLRHTAWTVGLVAATTTTAILVPQVETVFSFIDAAVFLLPGLFYLRVVPRGDTRMRFMAWLCLVLGAVLIPLCLGILTLQQAGVLQ